MEPLPDAACRSLSRIGLLSDQDWPIARAAGFETPAIAPHSIGRGACVACDGVCVALLAGVAGIVYLDQPAAIAGLIGVGIAASPGAATACGDGAPICAAVISTAIFIVCDSFILVFSLAFFR